MTKIWLLSDLHTETAYFELPPVPDGAQVLVIAGDVSEFHGAAVHMCQKWQKQSGLPVIFVPGNHDFYGSDLDVFAESQEVWDVMAGHDLHVLHSGQSVTIAGCRFVGATLWTDFAVNADTDLGMDWFDEHMPDAACISTVGRKLTGRDLIFKHQLQLAAIERVLAEPFDGPTVVVTHHAPHQNSLADPSFIDDADASFASDLTSTIMQYRPHAWLHGHVHSSHDYVVGDTWVMCNPRGYVTPRNNENRAFDPSLVISVG